MKSLILTAVFFTVGCLMASVGYSQQVVVDQNPNSVAYQSQVIVSVPGVFVRVPVARPQVVIPRMIMPVQYPANTMWVPQRVGLFGWKVRYVPYLYPVQQVQQ